LAIRIFPGTKKREFCGIVDVVAIRKDTSKSDHEILRMGDLFEIVLVQMKGGSARRPTEGDIERLRSVAERYHAKKVILFEWKRGEGCGFFVLDGDRWRPSTALEIFG
jgi:hypothetical protein